MSFFYSTVHDHTTAILRKFCESDVKQLQQYEVWRRMMVQMDAKDAFQRAEMLQRFTKVTADQKVTGKDSQSLSLASQSVYGPDGQPLVHQGTALHRGTRCFARNATSSELPQDVNDNAYDEDADDEKREEEANLNSSDYLPNPKYRSMNKLTEELLGPANASTGSAMIIDLLKGVYYVCGNLVDKESILRFIDAWEAGSLDPFEIRLPNPDEMIKDDDVNVVREMAMYAQPTHPSAGMSIIPGIVIWTPTRQHSESHMGPDSIYRALLNLAFQRCPREDRVSNYHMMGRDFDELEDDTRAQKKFLPWIQQFWIFGLQDTEEAQQETGAGTWKPPNSHFLAQLHSYVDELVQGKAYSHFHSEDHLPITRTRTARNSKQHYPQAGDDMLISQTDLFDEGLADLRASFQDSNAFVGNQNVCMRMAQTRRALHAAMLDELGYHTLVQNLPPPLFILFVGDLPAVDLLPWPSVLHMTHLHVLGSVPSICAYRDISPALTVQGWHEWAESTADDRLGAVNAWHIAVPWA
jgi:hypothetical protein